MREVQEIAWNTSVFFKPVAAGTASLCTCPKLMVHEAGNYARENQGNNGIKDNFLPQGLIGQCCIASVLVEDIECESPLDTGSKVTTVSETFYLTDFCCSCA